jgi:cardiolipin synthase
VFSRVISAEEYRLIQACGRGGDLPVNPDEPRNDNTAVVLDRREHESLAPMRQLADQAFSRAAGAPLVGGNRVRLLKDARENYPAWLDSIRSAEQTIHFESYIIHEDELGYQFAEALLAKARDGVIVRLIYDWLGAYATSNRFWQHLQRGGVEVRCYNPPRLDNPFGWVSRDHRKLLTVDSKVGFVTGLCVGRMWVGDPERHIDRGGTQGLKSAGPRWLTSSARLRRSGE